jgi:hypothetical protein
VQLARQRAKRREIVSSLELQDERVDGSDSLGQLDTEDGV